MPGPRKPRLLHVSVRVRVSVNAEKWQDTYGPEPASVEDGVRRYVVQLINDSPARHEGAIVGARRDAR